MLFQSTKQEYLSICCYQIASNRFEDKPSMKLDSANAHPMGSLIHDGIHRPFHALACPLHPRAVRIGKKK